jgi:hypothetical protein
MDHKEYCITRIFLVTYDQMRVDSSRAVGRLGRKRLEFSQSSRKSGGSFNSGNGISGRAGQRDLRLKNYW